MAEELGRPKLRFTPQTLQLLTNYPFSGNIRQLQNIIERAATLSDTSELSPESLPAAVRGEAEPSTTAVQLTTGFSLEKHLDELEHRYLTEALTQANGVKTRAAELLGLTFRSLRYRLAKYGLGEKEDRPPRPPP
jgi:two-component system response regulator PilR (NtrC family)